MVNINKLKYKIMECGITITDLAIKTNIDRSALYHKLNFNSETISIKEANLISKELNLTLDEVNSIFFS